MLSVYVQINMVSILYVVGVSCLPLSDSGPQYTNGWGQPVRLRHLYSVRRGHYLKIKDNGDVDVSVQQSYYSLLEIRPVGTGFIAIKGIASSRYLCMEKSGKLYGSSTYVEDCSFIERILPNGYSIYMSSTVGLVMSVYSSMLRGQEQDRSLSSSSLFLPMMSSFFPEPMNAYQPDLRDSVDSEPALEVDSMNPFQRFSCSFMHSPSFQ